MKNKAWIPHEEALESMEIVFNEAGTTLKDYAETFFILIENYEKELFPMKKANSLEALKFLIYKRN